MQRPIEQQILNLAKNARASCADMAGVDEGLKNQALISMSGALIREKGFIISENLRDLRGAARRRLPTASIDRLALNEERLRKMSKSLRSLAGLNDPVGGIIKQWRVASGLLIKKVRVPIGVIAIIYESRPDVTSDCIGLCLKSGNCLILRGGSEAINSNKAIFEVLSDAAGKLPIPKGAINFVSLTDRQAVKALLRLSNYIDLVIPRGGEGLIRQVAAISKIPVIKHYKGICHIYVDAEADLNMAEKVCFNAKVQRPGVCNAMESMLVHKDVAGRFLPGMIKMFNQAAVEIRGCGLTRKIVKTKVLRAREEDYRTEYLSLKLSVKVVEDVEAAVKHINLYGSGHSDAIITGDRKTAEYFLNKVDSACVYQNASTRFTDGYEFGLGAEIGISTDKIHARGPMALEELTTYKYKVFGNGQIRT